MDLWNNKNVLDLWSIMHFCFGLIICAVTYVLEIKMPLAIFVAVFLAVLWEIYERLRGINELWLNSLLDIVFTLLAFVLAFYLIRYLKNYNYFPYILIIFSLFVYIIIFIIKRYKS
jgi:hypothetical protein